MQLIDKTNKCPECKGEGKVEVEDKYRIYDLIIDIPYRKVDCPKCEGSGEIEETGENEILITAADISNPK